MHPNAMHRLQILEMLYQQLESKPNHPWVHQQQLNTFGEVDFTLVCLIRIGLAEKRNNSYQITGKGILEVEAQDS
ncbi:MAG: hypothetical protein JKY87_00215 [Mariprofundus sp.]|nr:hypothetical protein [Mariprofundus sp.]